MTRFISGYRGVNKQGLDYEVIEDKLAKKTKIKFDFDGAEVVTTRQYLGVGLPVHPTYGKPKPGDLYKDNKGNTIELVIKNEHSNWTVRWHKDNIEARRELQSIKAGSVRHPEDGKVEKGQVWPTNMGMDVTVLDYKNALEVLVQFTDGTTTKVAAQALRFGNVGHPTSGFVMGQKVKTSSGWVGEIVSYKSCFDVAVMWEDGSTSWHEASDIKAGSIKPVYQPSVAGVGYFGQGRFSNGRKIIGETPPKEVYGYWARMLNRCYNPEEVVKNKGRWYIYTEVHKDWFCFQNFAEWALSQPNWNLKYELDKDLIGTGWEYSSDSCTFLPADVNAFLAETKTRPMHDLPIGVQYLKPGTTGAKVGYVARCCTEKGREYLGYFDDPMEAYYKYKETKDAYGKRLAEKYKEGLSVQAYEKLANYELKTIYVPDVSSCIDRVF